MKLINDAQDLIFSFPDQDDMRYYAHHMNERKLLIMCKRLLLQIVSDEEVKENED